MAQTRRLGDYELGGIVGHGLVGILRESTFVPGGRDVVLEEIPSELASDDNFKKRLAAAGKIASSVTSPHLIPTYDVVTVDGELVVVTEPPGGPAVATLIATKALTPAAGLAVTCDVLNGLTVLHASGLHHGNVSPATVFITPAGDARLGEIAVASAHREGSADADLVAVTALLIALLGDNAMPLRIAAALKRAPGRGSPNPFADAAEYEAELTEAAASVFGAEWRRNTGLGERVHDAPQAAPALDLAAISASAGATPAGAVTAPPPPRAPAVVKRHRRWPWLVLVVVILLIGGGGAGAVLLAQNQPRVPGTGNGPELAVGNDLKVTVTPANGGCDTTFGFSATATVSGSGDLTYRWERGPAPAAATSTTASATPLAPTQTVHISSADGSFNLTQAWRLVGSQNVKGTMTFHMLTPSDRSVSQSFTYACS